MITTFFLRNDILASSQAPAIDVHEECAREPIHIPGSIQPYGVLIAFCPNTFVVTNVSDNIREVLGVEPSTILERPLSTFFTPESVSTLQSIIQNNTFEKNNLVQLSAVVNEKNFHSECVVHQSDNIVIVEMQELAEESGEQEKIFSTVNFILSGIGQSDSVEEYCHAVVQGIRDATGYDRVMIYKFHSNWDGEVIAESCDEKLEKFYGLRYPASDIPAQARELYLKNKLRVIYDVHYSASHIIPKHNTKTSQPLNLSKSLLRSVSPMHINYLINMGVRATMTISLLSEGKLWGLISCHHSQPKPFSFAMRAAYEIIGNMVGLQITIKEHANSTMRKAELAKKMLEIIDFLRTTPDIIASFQEEQELLYKALNASGMAVLIQGKIFTGGTTPDIPQIFHLASWVTKISPFEIFATDSLSKFLPEFRAFKEVASGFLSVPIGDGDIFMLFRPEKAMRVQWAGNPDKTVEILRTETGTKLSPRHSFALWVEKVEGQSEEWEEFELEAIRNLRSNIRSLVVESVRARMFYLRQSLGQEASTGTFGHSILDEFLLSITGDLAIIEALREEVLKTIQEPEQAEEIRNEFENIISANFSTPQEATYSARQLMLKILSMYSDNSSLEFQKHNASQRRLQSIATSLNDIADTFTNLTIQPLQ